MFKNLTIRKLSQKVIDRLGYLATLNERSVEGEARFALTSWITANESKEFQDSKSIRMEETGSRLAIILNDYNQKLGSKIKISHLAQDLGLNSADYLYSCFNSQLEPTFDELEQIGQLFGANNNWLKHGDNDMYPVNHEDMQSKTPKQITRWLLGLNEGDRKPTDIYFIRSSSKDGELAICRAFDDVGRIKKIETIFSGLHVSTEIGGTGTRLLSNFVVALEIIYKIYTGKSDIGHCKTHIFGRIIPDENFRLLVGGSTHPANVLHFQNLPWWEDIWDEAMRVKTTYWEGWEMTIHAAEAAIKYSDELISIRQYIRSNPVAMEWLYES